MKVFISQAMAGLDADYIGAQRAAAIKRVEEEFKPDIQDHVFGDDVIEFIDSLIEEEPPKTLEGDRIAIWYLHKSIELLATADLAVFLDGWNTARGCRCEELIANSYGIKCIYL